ncbi:MAG: AAA family ATPase [bacterium]|nr:AAA family ATPase [bacterium]
MRVEQLYLRNIGPFIEAYMEMDARSQVVLITGENGTGKSIILDAIRGMFGFNYGRLERDIRRQKCSGQAIVKIVVEAGIFLTLEQILPFGNDLTLIPRQIKADRIEIQPGSYLNDIPVQVRDGGKCPNWVVDFWPSTSPSGSYKINAFTNPNHRSFLLNALQGTKEKADITQLICHFDYMRDSRNPQEKAAAEHLYEILERIIANSLLGDGKLSHVARSTYEPIIIQNDQPVSLESLSGGNLYLIQNMVGLLGKMYSVHFLQQTPLSELCQTPGLLLIDEAENQLHPKWQKRFIRSILDIFPNLQIIATTHSPFIISSVSQAQVFVCHSKVDHCIVVDETAEYSNKPVDEILMSPLFEATQPFNEEISQLITERKRAIETGEQEKREQIEVKLKSLNPEYFSYFDTDKLLEEISGGGGKE